MPDFATHMPTIEYDPQGGMQTLQGILGIKARQLDIERGQAAVYQAQQDMRERQAGAALLQDPVKNGLTDADGTPTPNAQSILMRAMPTTWGKHYDDIVGAATKKVQFNSAVNALNNQERAEVTAAVAERANDPKSTPADVSTAVDNVVATKEGTPAYGQFKTVGDTYKQIVSRTAKVGQPDSWRQVAIGLNRQLLTPESVGGASGVATPQPGTTAAGQNINRNVATGERTMPGGAAPNPSSPTVAAATARATGVAGSDVDRANQVSSAMQASSAAIPLTQHIDSLYDQIHSGHFAAEISKAAAAVGMSNETYARQVLKKELGQVQAVAIANAPSDSARSTIQSGYPTDESDPQTGHTAMDYVRGSFRQNLARGDQLNRVRSKDPSLGGFQHADDILTRSTDPLMHEFASLKTAAERTAFYQRNFGGDAAKMAEFRDRVKGMGHAFGQGQ